MGNWLIVLRLRKIRSCFPRQIHLFYCENKWQYNTLNQRIMWYLFRYGLNWNPLLDCVRSVNISCFMFTKNKHLILVLSAVARLDFSLGFESDSMRFWSLMKQWSFPKCFTEFSEFCDKNICHKSKRARTGHSATSCVRDQMLPQCQQDTCVRDRIFKLSPIHASVIYQIP